MAGGIAVLFSMARLALDTANRFTVFDDVRPLTEVMLLKWLKLF
jgi:hypothetical protein